MSIMNTYTGKKFDPLQMKPEDVDMVDIAHALSLLCRGGGHIDRFYPVKPRLVAGNENSFLHVFYMMPAKPTLQILSVR